jgi:hypothetical protein
VTEYEYSGEIKNWNELNHWVEEEEGGEEACIMLPK